MATSSESAGRNFLSSLINHVRRGERVRALNDTFGRPTYAPDLARQLYKLAQLDLPGIYHVVNTGEGASFEAFVRRAVEMAGLDIDLVQAVSRDTLKRAAPAPPELAAAVSALGGDRSRSAPLMGGCATQICFS